MMIILFLSLIACHQVKPEEIVLRRAEWYQKAGVEIVRGVEAVSLLPGKVGDEGCWHKCNCICIYTNLGGG